MDQPTVGDMMAAYAQDAVEHAQSASGVSLDYSPDSVRHVEAVLQTLYAAIPRGFLGRLFGPSKEKLDAVSKMYGGYIGEVLRRAGGGEWTFETELAPGQTVICLQKGDLKIFPPSKVLKRLTNGAEDDVWMYCEVIMKDWK